MRIKILSTLGKILKEGERKRDLENLHLVSEMKALFNI